MKSDNNTTEHHLLQRYVRLVEIASELASILDLDELLNKIVTAAADVTESEAASILLYDEGKNELYFQSSTNMDTPLMRGFNVPVESSIAGEIVTTKKPLIVMNTQDDPRHFEQVSKSIQFQTQSLLGVPMITKDKVIGVVEALNKTGGNFDQDDTNLLLALGSQAAVAIENTRLFQQSDVVAEMVHELRTPLASISTAAHLLMRPEISQDQRSNMAETIQKETTRLSEMATTFLDLAKLESGRSQFKIEDVDLAQVLEESIDIMCTRADDQDIEIIREISPDLPTLKGDDDKLKQVALNFISNAIKYNRPNGTVTIGAGSDQNTIHFYITDTGPGMMPEHVENLFQKFYRVPGSEKRAQGTGLGLSITKKIIEGHGGEIIVESELGKGTTFKAVLPLKPDDS